MSPTDDELREWLMTVPSGAVGRFANGLGAHSAKKHIMVDAIMADEVARADAVYSYKIDKAHGIVRTKAEQGWT